MSDALRLATRGSALAMRQADAVRQTLERRNHAVEIVQIETRGDRLDDQLITELGKTGAFVRALDRRVLDGDADLAVHSMKDVPTDVPDGLVVAGVPERVSAGDLLVRPSGAAVEARDWVRGASDEDPLAALPSGAIVGTSSLRRGAQLLAERPDLTVEPLRGNVDTRIEKLVAPGLQRAHERRLLSADELATEGETVDGEATDDETDTKDEEIDAAFERSPEEWFAGLTMLEQSAMERTVSPAYDAIVLAEAGLRRADLRDHPAITTDRLPRSTFVPAPGQGALAVTASDPSVVETVRDALDHPPTRVTTTVERTVLSELGGGCVAPIGVHALLQGKYVATRVRVSGRDGDREVADTRDLPVERHAEAAREFAADLRDRGAAELIAEARREEPDEAKREVDEK